MKKKKAAKRDIRVEEKEFDAVLSQLLKMEPIKTSQLKTGHHGSKTLFRRKP